MGSIYKKRLVQLWLVLTLVACAGLLGSGPVLALAKLSYTEAQSATLKDILVKLQSHHYRNMPVDDELSKRFLDNYLNTLDQSHMFFYQKDIDAFRSKALTFDDDFRAGDLSLAYRIYDTYRLRVSSRLNLVLDLLADNSVKFEFTDNDEVLLDRKDQPWPSTLSDADQLWYQHVKLSLLNLKMAGKDLAGAKEVLTKRYKRQLRRVEQEESADVFETIANALTVLYDPHTNYFSPRTSENFNISMSLSLEGIGAVLQSEDEHTKVVSLVAGGPADKQGQLKAADRIVSVAQGDEGELVDVIGWRLDEVVDLIRGPANTVVKLEVLPASGKVDTSTKIIRINRGHVKLEDQAAQKAVFELAEGEQIYKLGVIDLPTFYSDFDAHRRGEESYKSSSRDVAKLLQELIAENVDGVILDLRNNGGGSLDEATYLTDLFIDRGPVVQIRSSDNHVNRHKRSRYQALYRGPLIVMVNRLSASASEIFAGAIQDYQRGVIVGTQTFGKGSVQSVLPLLEGQLKITESKFYRVSGDSTQHRGVIPDILLPPMVDPSEVGESSYDTALPWDQIHSVPHAQYFDFSSIVPIVNNLHQKRAANDPDYAYIVDQISLVNSNKARNTISLNEKRRLQEKDKLELQAMEIDNKRRKAKNLEPYASLDAFRSAEEQEKDDNDQTAARPQNKIDVDGDALLIETGNIMVDMIRLSNKPDQRQALRLD